MHVCMYIYIYIYVCKYIRTYTHIHISVQIFLKNREIFALIHIGEWGTSFPYPSLSFSPPYLTSSQAPRLPQNFSTQGWLFWSGAVGKVALWHSFQLNVLSPVCVISPVVSKLPREKEQRSGVYRMSVFKVTLCVSHLFFFFFKGKKSTVFVLFCFVFGGG